MILLITLLLFVLVFSFFMLIFNPGNPIKYTYHVCKAFGFSKVFSTLFYAVFFIPERYMRFSSVIYKAYYDSKAIALIDLTCRNAMNGEGRNSLKVLMDGDIVFVNSHKDLKMTFYTDHCEIDSLSYNAVIPPKIVFLIERTAKYTKETAKPKKNVFDK